jgi:uncharacterized protein YqeY
MALRDEFTDVLKTAMRAGDSARVSTLRMILSKVKDADIAARPKGIDKVPDEEVLSTLRGMVKSRRESVELYRQGNRPELADKEEAEIAVIETFLPKQMDEAAAEQAVADAIADAIINKKFWILTHERAALRTTEQRLEWMRGAGPTRINLDGATKP